MNPLLVMEGITKSFPGVKALNNVNFELRSGEVHALIGENGAGKSTLMKILTGSYIADEGKILIDGQPANIDSPRSAQLLGINIIHQEIHMIPHLSVAENIFIGFEPRNKHFKFSIDYEKMNKRAAEILKNMNMEIDPTTKVLKLSIAQQQMVAIARIIALKSRVVIMDEPTASLTDSEIKFLYGVIDKLKKQGVGIVYISHRMEELEILADRVTVLRDGTYIKSLNYSETTPEHLIALMVGRELKDQYPSHKATRGESILKVKKLSTKEGIDIKDFELRAGEITGFYGLVGAGRTEFAKALFGADKSVDYEVYLKNKKINVRNPQDAISNGLCYMTEDRKGEGLALGLSVENNISLANLPGLANMGVINDKKSRQIAENYVKELKIKTPSLEQPAKFLSGGNQQKVILAKWLSLNIEVLIIDEPTRGIDVGTKKEVYELINRLVENGIGVIVISSDLPEVLGISDRIVVMHDMKIKADIPRNEATQEKLLEYAVM